MCFQISVKKSICRLWCINLPRNEQCGDKGWDFYRLNQGSLQLWIRPTDCPTLWRTQRNRKHNSCATAAERLFFLFVMNGMFPKSGAVFAQFEFFPSRLFSDGVIVISGLFTDEKNCFRLFFAFFTFCHVRSPDDVEPHIITEAPPLTSPTLRPRRFLGQPICTELPSSANRKRKILMC